MERIWMTLGLALALAAGPAAGADLWCMPDRICLGERCKAPQSEEASVRLNDADSARPVLRSDAEDVPMRVVRNGAVPAWQGHNRAGGSESLAWRRDDGGFVYQRRLDGAVYTATGRCEVQ